MKPTVVILLSDKRSGSTMFQNELCKHPQIQTVDYSPHTYLETHHWLKGAVILGKPAETFAEGKVYEGYGTVDNARAYLIDCIVGNVPEFEISKDDQELVMNGWEVLCEKFAKPIFFEKSPQFLGNWASLSLLLEWMRNTSFSVKVIGLTRNPLSVQYSSWKLFHTLPEKRQFGWLLNQKNLLEFKSILSPEQFLHIMYEHIIQSPIPTFEQICRFIGVEPDNRVGEAVHSQSLTKWVDDPYFTLQLDESVKVMARKFGYSDDDLYNPPKPDPPLSYKLGKACERAYKLSKARLNDRILKPIRLRQNTKIG